MNDNLALGPQVSRATNKIEKVRDLVDEIRAELDAENMLEMEMTTGLDWRDVETNLLEAFVIPFQHSYYTRQISTITWRGLSLFDIGSEVFQAGLHVCRADHGRRCRLTLEKFGSLGFLALWTRPARGSRRSCRLLRRGDRQTDAEKAVASAARFDVRAGDRVGRQGCRHCSGQF